MPEAIIMITFVQFISIFILSSFAAWETASEADKTRFYIDSGSIQVVDNIKKVWELQDISDYGGDERFSYRYLSYYDCENRLWRYSEFSRHSGPMASGKISYKSKKPSKWKVIPPNTPAASILAKVCSTLSSNER